MTDGSNRIDATQRSAARVAGLAYLIPLALVVYANFGLRARLFAAGDWAETVRRIAAAEPLFRLSLAFDLGYCIGLVVLLSAVYVVLAPVDRHLALLATLLKFVHAVTAVLVALNLLTVLRLSTDPAYLQAFKAEPLQALVRLHSSLTGGPYYVGLAFWSLASTVLGWLWLKSRYIPVALAWSGLIASAWCLFCTFAFIIHPAFSDVVNLWWFDSPMVLFEIVLGVWLLARGLRPPAALAA